MQPIRLEDDGEELGGKGVELRGVGLGRMGRRVRGIWKDKGSGRGWEG